MRRPGGAATQAEPGGRTRAATARPGTERDRDAVVRLCADIIGGPAVWVPSSAPWPHLLVARGCTDQQRSRRTIATGRDGTVPGRRATLGTGGHETLRANERPPRCGGSREEGSRRPRDGRGATAARRKAAPGTRERAAPRSRRSDTPASRRLLPRAGSATRRPVATGPVQRRRRASSTGAGRRTVRPTATRVTPSVSAGNGHETRDA